MSEGLEERAHSLLLLAAQAADRAVGQLAVSERAAKVADGADGEPTTAVDRAAEQAVIDALSAVDMPLRVISEERGTLTLVEGDDPLVVLCDPVDSTTNATLGLPIYTTALVAFRRGQAQAAVVRNLATHETYSAKGAEAAFFNGQPIRCPKRALADSVITYGPIREAFAQQVLIDVVGASRGIRLFACPSWSLAAVADGRAGGYVGLGQTYPVHRLFDVLAAAVVVRAAGGVVSDHLGQPWQVALDDLHSAVTVVAGSAAVHGELLALISRRIG